MSSNSVSFPPLPRSVPYSSAVSVVYSMHRKPRSLSVSVLRSVMNQSMLLVVWLRYTYMYIGESEEGRSDQQMTTKLLNETFSFQQKPRDKKLENTIKNMVFNIKMR